MKLFLSLIITLTLTACGGGGNDSATPPAPVFSPSLVVFEGDSLTELNDATTWPIAVQAHSTWHAVWQDKAVSGSDTIKMLARYGAVKKATGATGVFIVHCGTNDLRDGDEPADVYARLKTEWAQARADGFKVVAATTHAARSKISPEVARTQVATLNTMIRSDPSLYDALVEYDKVFPDPTDITMLYDGLHFTPAANDKVATAVETVLLRLR